MCCRYMSLPEPTDPRGLPEHVPSSILRGTERAWSVPGNLRHGEDFLRGQQVVPVGTVCPAQLRSAPQGLLPARRRSDSTVREGGLPLLHYEDQAGLLLQDMPELPNAAPYTPAAACLTVPPPLASGLAGGAVQQSDRHTGCTTGRLETGVI